MAVDPNSSLHDVAVDVSDGISKLIQGLAHSGASPQAVEGLTHMKSIIDQVTKVLATSPHVEKAAKSGPPDGPRGPMAPASPTNDPDAQGPSNPTPGAPGGPPPRGPFGSAAQGLHNAMTGNPHGAAA